MSTTTSTFSSSLLGSASPISGSQAPAIAASAAIRAAIPSFKNGARIVGAVFGAGALVAAQQLAYEEGRALIAGARTGGRLRRDRNAMVVLALARSGLPLEMQDQIRRSWDSFKCALKMLTDERISEHHRIILRTALEDMVAAAANPVRPA